MHIYVDIWPIGMSRSELFEAKYALQYQLVVGLLNIKKTPQYVLSPNFQTLL